MNRKSILIVGVILLIIGSVSAYEIWKVHKPSSLLWHNGFKYAQANTINLNSTMKAFPADESKVNAIHIDATNSDIVVTTGAKFEINLTYYSPKQSEKALSVSFKSDTLTIKQNNTVNDQTIFSLGEPASKITIVIPDKSPIKSVYASNQYGNLTFKNLNQIPSISANNENGIITFNTVSATSANISAQNEDMLMYRVTFDQATFQNISGDIEVEDSKILLGGKIINQTGDIYIKDTGLPPYYLMTTNGDKEISREQIANKTTKARADLCIRNETGDISIN